jgi:hypothetical protein
MGYVDASAVIRIAESMKGSGYGDYLIRMLEQERAQ